MAINPISIVVQVVGNASSQLQGLTQQLNQAQQAASQFTSKQSEGVKGLAFAYELVRAEIELFKQVATRSYDLLIGQNVELREAILGTQAAIASSQKVFQNGIEIKDPVGAIQALQQPIAEQIKQLRKDALDLNGVTSNDLIPIFQAIATGSSALRLKEPLQDAEKLTISLTAASQGLRIPLQQAQSEIQGIVRGEINHYNVLAKGLQLSQAQFNQLQAQGKLYEYIVQKAQPLLEGQKLGAELLPTVTSNLQEILQNITQPAGESFLDLITQRLNQLFLFLKANQPAIEASFKALSDGVFHIFQALDEVGRSVGEDLAPIVKDFFPPLVRLLQLMELGFVKLISLLGAAFKFFEPVLKIQLKLLSTTLDWITRLQEAQVFLNGIVNGSVRDAQEGLDAYVSTNETLAQEAQKSSSALKAAAKDRQEAEKSGKELSEEKVVAEKKAQIVAQATIAQLKSQVEEMKRYQAITESQRQTKASEINNLETYIRALEKSGGSTKLAAKDLLELGSTFKQLEDKANGAIKTLELHPDLAGTEAAAQSLVEITQRQLELGQITREEAVSRFEKVAQMTTINADIQIKAQKAITDAQKTEGSNQVAEVKLQQEETKSLIDSNQLGAIDGEKRLTALKKHELETQLENTREALQREQKEGRGSGQYAAELTRQANSINAQLRTNEATSVEQGRKERLKDIERRQQENQSDLDRRAEGEAEFSRRSIENTRSRINEEIRQLREKRAKLPKGDKDLEVSAAKEKQLQGELAKADEEYLQGRARAKSTFLQGEVTQSESEFSRRLITEREFADKSLALTKSRLDAEIAEIERQRSRLPKSDVEGREALNTKEAELRKQRFEAEENYQQKRAELQTQFIQSQAREIESDYAQRLITEEDYNEKSLENTRDRLRVELAEVKRQRNLLPAGDIERREALNAKEAELQRANFEAEEKFQQTRYQARVRHFDDQQKLLEASLSEGAIAEASYNQQSLAGTQQKLNLELEEVNRQRNLIKSGDIQALEDLAAKESDIRKRQVEALEQYNQRQVAAIERSVKKASDAVRAAETDRLISLQQLENSHSVTRTQVEKLRVDETAKRVKQELAIEQDKYQQLSRLAPLTDPIKEEARQSQLRESRLRTADLVKQLAENELRQQEAITKVAQEQISRRLQIVKNASQVENIELEKQSLLQDALTQSIDHQNKLLQARKELTAGLASYFEGELDVLAKTSNNEREKKQLAETTAALRLKSLRQQQEIERDILELNLKQQEAALKKEQIANRIQQLQNRSEILEAQANYAKSLADRGALPEEREAARLAIISKIEQGANLRFSGALIEQQSGLQRQVIEYQRFNMANQQRLAADQARLAFAESRVNSSDRAKDLQALRREVEGNLLNRQSTPFAKFGVFDNSLQRYGRVAESENFFDPSGNPIAGAPVVRENLPFQQGAKLLPTSVVMPDYEAVRQQFVKQPLSNTGDNNAVVLAIKGLEAQFKEVAAGAASVAQTNQITNNFTGAEVNSGQFAKQVEQQTINTSYKALLLLQQKK